MICRIRADYGNNNVVVAQAIGEPAQLEQAAYDDGALGVTVMVLS
jgi:hypothetical protein